MRLFFRLLLLMLPTSLLAQGVRYDSQVTTTSSQTAPGALSPVLAVPFAQVTVCKDAACANQAAIYNDAGLTQLITQPLITGARGQFGFWIAPLALNQGSYFYQVSTASGAFLGTFPITLTTGPTGATGATGPVGPTGATGPPATYRGTYSNATTYNQGDAVFYTGSSFVSLINSNLNNTPAAGSAQWGLLAQKGSTGAAGIASLPQLSTLRTLYVPALTNLVMSTGWQGGYIDSTNGSFNPLGGGWAATPCIVANAGGTMTLSQLPAQSGPNGIAFYDQNLAYVSGIVASSVTANISVPSAAACFRMASNAAGFQSGLEVFNGTVTVPAQYVGPNFYSSPEIDSKLSSINSAISTLVPATALAANLGAARGMIETPGLPLNVFQWKDAVPGVLAANNTINSSGGFGSNWFTTGYTYVYGIPQVSVNATVQDLSSSGYPNLAYDISGNVLGNVSSTAVTNGTQLTYPTGTVRIRFSMNQNVGTASTLAVWAGTTVPTSVTPFPANLADAAVTKANSAVASAASAVALAQPWAGKPMMVFGTSISAGFNNAWQNVSDGITGMTLGLQRDQSGRSLANIFQDYYNSGTLTVNTAALQADLEATATAGGMVVIEHGTNDVLCIQNGTTTLGTITDTPSAAPVANSGDCQTTGGTPPPGTPSFYAYAAYTLDTITSLAPNLPILVVGPYHRDRNPNYPIDGNPVIFNNTTTDPFTDQVDAALAALCAQRGIRYYSQAHSLQFNKNDVVTSAGHPYMTRDGLHPSDNLGFPMMGAGIAHEINLLPLIP